MQYVLLKWNNFMFFTWIGKDMKDMKADDEYTCVNCPDLY